MNVSYEYDQDPRYGWVNISMGEKKEGLIVVQDADGLCHGFNYRDGEMKPTCICSAFHRGECCCTNVDWND